MEINCVINSEAIGLSVLVWGEVTTANSHFPGGWVRLIEPYPVFSSCAEI